MEACAKFAVVAACLALLGTVGCDHGCSENGSGVCFPAPNEPIEKFEITVDTGYNPTTADIYFCYKRFSSVDWSCHNLNHKWHNDFASDETDRYTIKLKHPIAVGDLERFRLKMEESQNHHSWEIVGLTVLVGTSNGREFVIYYDSEIDCDWSITSGNSYWPRECPY